jgi:hypothetical protein
LTAPPCPLGRVVATTGALQLLEKAGEDPFRYLAQTATLTIF